MVFDLIKRRYVWQYPLFLELHEALQFYLQDGHCMATVPTINLYYEKFLIIRHVTITGR